MPIALDTSTDGGVTNTTTTHTFSHTCSGADRILWVGAFGDENDNVSGITYNGVAMSRVGTALESVSARRVYLYVLVGPATGANNVVITTSVTVDALAGHAVSHTGATQSGQPDSSNTNTATAATSVTGSTTVVASNCWLVCVTRNELGAASAGTGTTQRVSSANGLGMFDSNATVGTGSQSLQATFGSATEWGIVIASFSPSVGGEGGLSVRLEEPIIGGSVF